MTDDTIHTCSYECERPGCIRAQRDELVAKVEALRAEVEKLRADLMESDEIREKLSHLLTRTAAALKGEPPEGVWHSWHDLPERASELQAEVEKVTCELMDAITRADKLAEALEEIRSRSSIDFAMRSDQFELTARLGDIYQIADAALGKEADRG